MAGLFDPANQMRGRNEMKNTEKTGNKRDRLIDATKTLLWKIGYETMSPKKILQESGAGQGSLYHHFSGKMALASTALDEMEAEMHARFDQVFASQSSPIKRLQAYLTLEREGLKGCRLGRLANETSIADETLRAPLERYFSHVQTVVTQTLHEAIQQGEIDKTISPADIAAALVAVVQGGYTLCRIHQDPAHIKRATHGALTMLNALSLR
jgi:AcrR family transcriptional regulator